MTTNKLEQLSTFYVQFVNCNYIFFVPFRFCCNQQFKRNNDYNFEVNLANLSRTGWTARASAVRAFNQSLEPILDLLEEISNDKALDSNTRTKSFGLLKKIKSLDFMVTFSFMINILEKIQILTLTLESPSYNVIDGITVIQSTSRTLQEISNDSEAMNDLIESATTFSTKIGIDVETEFKRHYRMTDLNCKAFYRREFKEILNTLAMELIENSTLIKDLFGPLAEMFSFPLKKDNITVENLEKAMAMVPPGSRKEKSNVFSLKTQMEILFEICNSNECENPPAESLQDVPQKSSES